LTHSLQRKANHRGLAYPAPSLIPEVDVGLGVFVLDLLRLLLFFSCVSFSLTVSSDELVDGDFEVAFTRACVDAKAEGQMSKEQGTRGGAGGGHCGLRGRPGWRFCGPQVEAENGA